MENANMTDIQHRVYDIFQHLFVSFISNYTAVYLSSNLSFV